MLLSLEASDQSTAPPTTGIQQVVFITLCGFTAEAKQSAEKHGIEIINETGLAHYRDCQRRDNAVGSATQAARKLRVMGKTRRLRSRSRGLAFRGSERGNAANPLNCKAGKGALPT